MESLRQSSRGRYEILEQIGQGSMGAVYRARRSDTGEEVALKVLNKAGSLDDADLDRVRRLCLNEASAASVASHPGLVRILDLVDEPGSAEIFLVMEYVPGSSLAELLSRPDPLSLDFIVKLVREVAAALDHVHAHGVVHRDVKPANILLGLDGAARVADFGISELRSQDLSADLQRAGTPGYMAPERVLGTGCDHRCDVWALGVVLYEMLTRRLPFQGGSVAEVVTRLASEEPAPLDAHGVAVLPGLQPIVDRALAKEPDERYASAGDLARDLEKVQASQLELSATLPATAIPMLDPAPDPAEGKIEDSGSGRVRGALAHFVPGLRTAAALGVAFVLLTGLMLVARGRTPAAPPESRSSEEARRFEYLALLDEAGTLLEQGEPEAAAELFARAETLAPASSRIRALRQEARRQAEREIASEIDLEVAALVGIGEADLAAGRLSAAEDAALRALEMSPRHPEARALAAAVDAARQAALAEAERMRVAALRAAAPPPPPPAEKVERLRVEQPIRPPASAPVPTYSDLKVDFYSALPRGVLTVYRAQSQILRRPFRFVERKRFMRTTGVSGGFDEQVRVKAGPSEFRVYLSLPDRSTQVRRLSGILPPGAIRALQVRVDAEGSLSVALH